MSFVFPMFFSGMADVCAWWDETEQCFRIKVDVTNSRWGPLFGMRTIYGGLENGEAGDVPREILPKRVEARE